MSSDVSKNEVQESALSSQSAPGGFDMAAVDRRRFLKSLGIAGVALASGAGVASAAMGGAADVFGNRNERPITRGDVAILRLLAAAEIIETDLWRQYNELGGVDAASSGY